MFCRRHTRGRHHVIFHTTSQAPGSASSRPPSELVSVLPQDRWGRHPPSSCPSQQVVLISCFISSIVTFVLPTGPASLPSCLHTLLSSLEAGLGLPLPANYPLWKPLEVQTAGPGPSTPLCHAGTCTLGSILCVGTFPGCSYLYRQLPPTSADPPAMLSCADAVSVSFLCSAGRYWGHQLSTAVLRCGGGLL